MLNVFYAYESLFTAAIWARNSPLSDVKMIISWGFENHKVLESEMPAIQIRTDWSTQTARWVPQSYITYSMFVHLIYNFSAFKWSEQFLNTKKVKRIITTHTIVEQMEKRSSWWYDSNSIAGIIDSNQTLVYNNETVGDNVNIVSIQYGIFTRASGENVFPTGEAIINFTVDTNNCCIS